MSRYASARLVRCRACRLVFAGELPTTLELRKHYAHYPASGQLPELTVRRYSEVLKQLEPFRHTGRLLDIGCGDGQFLIAAREHGWTVYGTEYGEAPLRRARQLGLDVRPAPFPAATEELASFDVATAMEVLEHIADPRDEAERIRTLLRGGGCLYLTSPNFSSLSRRIAGPRWRAVEYPEHLNLFTPATLHRLLATAGLKRQFVRTTGISPTDIWTGIRPRGLGMAGNAAGACFDQRIRAGMADSRMLDRSVWAANLALSWLGIGDTIKALYRR